jgi:hypothetical protein
MNQPITEQTAPQTQPVLQTNRLILRPFVLSDANDVQRLAGDFAVADTTLNIPHPYPEGAAEEFFSTHKASRFGFGDNRTYHLSRFSAILRGTCRPSNCRASFSLAASRGKG